MYIYSIRRKKTSFCAISAKYLMVILWLSYGYPVAGYAKLTLKTPPCPLCKGERPLLKFFQKMQKDLRMSNIFSNFACNIEMRTIKVL